MLTRTLSCGCWQLQSQKYVWFLLYSKSLKWVKKKASLAEVQQSGIVVLHQEGYSEKQIITAENCSKTAMHKLYDCLKILERTQIR